MAWKELDTPKAVEDFMRLYGYFHDGCIKEIKYISGLFVDESLSMNPISSKKKLRVIFQRQFIDPTVVEIVFEGLVRLNLCPEEEGYTGEITGAYMGIHDGMIYWAEIASFNPSQIHQKREYNNFTWIVAKSAKWRKVDEFIGEDEIYVARR